MKKQKNKISTVNNDKKHNIIKLKILYILVLTNYAYCA